MYPFDPNRQQMYEQYIRAHETGDHSGIDHDQAVEHVQQFMQQAPPELQQQVCRQHFEQMPYAQRQQFAQQVPPYQPYMDATNPQQMAQRFYQLGQQQPGRLQQLLGQGSSQGGFLGSPLSKAAAIGIAALAAQHLLGGHGGAAWAARCWEALRRASLSPQGLRSVPHGRRLASRQV
jgi:hypothetical protein